MINMNRLFSPWVIVTTGIIFNIISALITHYYIGVNNEQIDDIERQINSKQVLIDSLWQSKTEIERKKEFFILLLQIQGTDQSPNWQILNRHYRDYVAETVDTYQLPTVKSNAVQSTPQPELLLQLSKTATKTIIETINNTYFERIELEETKFPLEQDNARLLSIAIFLQLVGLILVLARDLRRT